MKTILIFAASALIIMAANTKAGALQVPNGDYPARAVMNFFGKNICLEVSKSITLPAGGDAPVIAETRSAIGSNLSTHSFTVTGVGHVLVNEEYMDRGDCTAGAGGNITYKPGEAVNVCLPSSRPGKIIKVKLEIKPDAPQSEGVLQKVVHAMASCEIGASAGYYQPGDKINVGAITMIHPPLDWQKPLPER